VLTNAWSTAVSPLLIGWSRPPGPDALGDCPWGARQRLLSMLAVGIPFVLTFYLVIAALED
jgi:hypothetical protein